jgi:hypothetical protein
VDADDPGDIRTASSEFEHRRAARQSPTATISGSSVMCGRSARRDAGNHFAVLLHTGHGEALLNEGPRRTSLDAFAATCAVSGATPIVRHIAYQP